MPAIAVLPIRHSTRAAPRKRFEGWHDCHTTITLPYFHPAATFLLKRCRGKIDDRATAGKNTAVMRVQHENVIFTSGNFECVTGFAQTLPVSHSQFESVHAA